MENKVNVEHDSIECYFKDKECEGVLEEIL